MRDACEDKDHNSSAHGFNLGIGEYTNIPGDLLLMLWASIALSKSFAKFHP